MNNLNIRTATIDDANLLSVLSTVTFYEAYFEDDEQKDIAAYIVKTYHHEQLTGELKDENSTFLLAEANGKAIGFAKLRENSIPECLRGENTVELHRLYLMERFWRRGIGRSLVEKSLSVAKERGYHSLWLGTWAENIRAQKFYATLGFTRAGEFQYDYESKIAVNYVLVKEVGQTFEKGELPR
jgi:ribosomal protein S18 acetylase RimI-like enzyme